MNHKQLERPQETIRGNLTSEKESSQEWNKPTFFPLIINLTSKKE